MRIRSATRREVGKFFRAVNRSHMRSATQLLSEARLALADEFFVALVGNKIVGAVCLVAAFPPIEARKLARNKIISPIKKYCPALGGLPQPSRCFVL